MRWMIGPDRWLTFEQPRILGILNTTPDSFSDGGRWLQTKDAVRQGEQLIDDGADIIDVGGESTRPGAERVAPAEQVRRTIDVIKSINERKSTLLSIDTTSAVVAERALMAGACIINDVSAGQEDAGIFELAAAHRCGLILMHRRTEPQNDRYSDQYSQPPVYEDVSSDVATFLRHRIEAAIAAGVLIEQIAIDPGLGFGKTVDQNLQLIRETVQLLSLGCPVVSGSSRKSFLGALVDEPDPSRRDAATIAASVMHWRTGASLFRVHNVRDHRHALDTTAAILPRLDVRSSVAVEPGGVAATIPATDSSTGDSSAMASDHVHEFTDANFDQEVLKSDVPVLVDFWAEWCQPCKMLTPFIEEIASEYDGKAKVGKVDTDSNREISMQYNISAIPTVLLFRNGEIERKFVGLTNKDEFAGALDAMLA